MTEYVSNNIGHRSKSASSRHSISRSTNDVLHDVTDIGHHVQHFKVFRGMSPNTSNRLEHRIRELEDSLEAEREARLRYERDNAELALQLDELSARLEEAEGLSFSQSETGRRKEDEVKKLKKDLETVQLQYESSETTQRRRQQELEKELSEQLEKSKKDKQKMDLSKQQLLLELENYTVALESANKSREMLEGKLEEIDGNFRRLQLQHDDLLRQSNDYNSLKSRLSQENQELRRQVADLDSNNSVLMKLKSTLQGQLDETASNLEEELRMRNQLAIQVTNLQIELDTLTISLDEQAELTNSLRAQLGRAQIEYQQIKSKYDSDVVILAEELDSTRRKLGQRITELEEALEQARNRAVKLEKEKLKIQIELKEVISEYETANSKVLEVTARLKQADHAVIEARGRAEDLQNELQRSSSESEVLRAELARVKPSLDELQRKIESLTKDNRDLSDSVEEYKLKQKDQLRQVHDLQALRIELETERNVLVDQLHETREDLGSAQHGFESANQLLAQLKIETETRLREKDDEADVIRKSSQNALEELQTVIREMESKYKAEISKLRRHHDTEVEEYQQQLDSMNRTSGELGRANKSLAARVKELEASVEEERRARESCEQVAGAADRKRIQLQTQLEDVRTLLESTEKARKTTSGELTEATARIAELQQIQATFTAEARRLEADRAGLVSQAEEQTAARRTAEERADRLHGDLVRLQEEFARLEEGVVRQELERRQMEGELRDVRMRLEQAETVSVKEGKRLVARLNARMLELESELSAEQRRSRDVAGEHRKIQKLYQEIKSHSDCDREALAQQNELNASLQSKVNALRRQLQEAEEVIGITMNKYRKAMQALDEAERNVEVTRSASGGLQGGGASHRSMSVVREVTRVVRV